MKIKKLFLSAFIALAVMATFSACSKDKYQPKGNYVTQGTSIMKDYTVTVFPSQWLNEGGGEYGYMYNLNQNFPSNSLVHVYVVMNDGSEIPLPYTSVAGKYQFTFQTHLSGSADYVKLLQIDENLIPTPPSVAIKFRIVIVPPSVRMANPNIDWNNPDEVKKALILEKSSQTH